MTPRDAAEVADVLRDATAQGCSVAVRGAGTKDAWGGTLSTVDLVLETVRLAGVVAHEPGDRVVTVRAGTRLRDLQAVLGLAGQRLAVESGFPDATIGGVLASGEAGPLRVRHGTGKDLLIGVEFVRADGVVAHSGGRVVKNVAGYDLGRLLCGSFGTVGIITEATFRLQPLPAASGWVVAPLSTVEELAGYVSAAGSPSVEASAVELDWSTGGGSVAVLVEGSTTGVAARATTLRGLLPAAELADAPPAWWGRYPFADGDVGLKLAVPVSVLPAAIGVLRTQLGDALVRGSAGAGVVHVAVAGSVPTQSLGAAVRGVRALLPHTGGSCVVLTAPPSIRDSLDLWGPVPGLALMRRLKEQFDPAGRFAAGRFVGGL